MAETTLIRCELLKHPATGQVPRVPIAAPLPDDPGELAEFPAPPVPEVRPEEVPPIKRNSNIDERTRDDLVRGFINAYENLRRQDPTVPSLSAGVDPEWYFERVEPSDDERRTGFTVVWDLRRLTPLVPVDQSNSRAAQGIQLASEVPPKPGAAMPATPPVLPPGQVPPPAVQGQPAAPAVSPAPCGGANCAVVNGVEAHAENCPARGQ